MNIVSCEFCDELQGGVANAFHAQYASHKMESRLISRTENFAVMPGLGGLSVGYLILMTVPHNRSFSQIPVSQFLELDQTLSRIKEVIFQRTGLKCVVFEHGHNDKQNSSSQPSCGVCIDHAHLHICPTDSDFCPSVLQVQSTVSYLGKMSELGKLVDSDYLMYWGTDGQIRVFTLQESVPSQFFRQLWATNLHTREWDWAIFPHLERLAKTLDLFRDS